jgi:hypothetical protein
MSAPVPPPPPRPDRDGLRVAVSTPVSRTAEAASASLHFPHPVVTDDAPGKVAVLVCHGMGQQVPFETLDCVAKALSAQEEKRSGRRETQVRFVRLGERRLPRAELLLTGPGGAPREVHVYEGYWAPLMEGRVSAWDVTRFLFGAGWSGIAHSLPRRFDRWMFGTWHELSFPASTGVSLALAFVLVLAVFVLYAALFFVIAGKLVDLLFTFKQSGFRAGSLVDQLTLDLFLSPYALAVPLLVLFFLSSLLPSRRGGRRRTRRWLGPVILGAMGIVGAWTVLSAALAALHAVQWIGKDLADPVDRWGLTSSAPLFLAFLLGALIATWVARWFYIQYFGDVAAYVSSHKVNRFSEVRDQVKAVGREAARAIYGARDAGGTGFEYQRVLMVGHSLGSVVAYDTLNGMLNDDLETGGGLNVAARTQALVTFGSPLDKTAFIFRTQIADAEIREALSAANQPLIQPPDGGGRRIPWINLWSPYDPVSGELNFYDPPEGREPAGHLRVRNRVDPDANLPAVAHTQYWENRTLAEILYDQAAAPIPSVSP